MLAELRTRRLGEQEALIAALAEERAAAAAAQADAERAIDAAKHAELSAAKVLADLRAQADSARKQVGWILPMPVRFSWCCAAAALGLPSSMATGGVGVGGTLAMRSRSSPVVELPGCCFAAISVKLSDLILASEASIQ